MNTGKTYAVMLMITLHFIMSACGTTADIPAPATDPPQPTDLPTAEQPSPTPELAPTESSAPSNQETGYEVEETKTTLLVYIGEVRVSHDDGQSWGLADTGLWLESGDRLQVTPGGLALILFPDGSLIRLEGFTDFKLVLNEFNFETGVRRVIGRVLEGAALAATVPLPNPESLFQLWVMTTLIDLPYDADQAVSLDSAETVSPEKWVTFGGSMREDLDGEFLFNFADSVLPEYYALEIIDGDLVLIKTTPAEGQLTQYFLPFRENIEDEFELEGALDVAAGILTELRGGADPSQIDFYGYTLFEEGSLSDNQVLFSVLEVDEVGEFLAEAASNPEEAQEFISYVSRSPAYKRHELHYRYFKEIPDIFAPEILLMLEKYQMGCDIESGLGCAVPDGCDPDSGEGCTFTSGCNIITREGCKKARLSCIAYTNCDWAPCGRRPVISHFCKPRVRTYCDPEVPGDCDQYLESNTDQVTDDSVSDQDSGEDSTLEESSADNGRPSESTQSLEMPDYTLPLELVQDPDLAGQPLYDPNDPESLTPFYDTDFWQKLIDYYRNLYGGFEDDDWDDEDIEWCTCTASYAGYPPPPPWMDMTYRCWCSDPGAK